MDKYKATGDEAGYLTLTGYEAGYLTTLGWLTLEHRWHLNKALLMHKIANNDAPMYLTSQKGIKCMTTM